MDELVSPAVRDFILRHIDSVAQLEALLLLRANPGESWTVPMVANRLYTTEAQAGEILGQLCRDQLIACESESYRYDAGPADQSELVRELATVYGRHLIQITNMIHAKPRRIRAFADAFKIRKDR